MKQKFATATGDPGRAGLRRLNRAEYAAALRDLLSIEMDVSALLPADDANHGFDNMSDALRVAGDDREAFVGSA